MKLPSSNVIPSSSLEHAATNQSLQAKNYDLAGAGEQLRRQIESAVLINQALEAAIAQIEISVVILDINRHIKSFVCKPNGIINLLSSDIGIPISGLKPNIIIKRLDQQVLEVMTTLVVKEAEVQDSAQRWHRMQIRPTQNADGKLTGAIISLFDVQAVHGLRTSIDGEIANAQAASATIELFLASLSHALRTPLTALLLQAQLLLRAKSDDPRVTRAALAIEKAARIQSQLIDDIFGNSEAMTEKSKMEYNSLDLSQSMQVRPSRAVPHIQNLNHL